MSGTGLLDKKAQLKLTPSVVAAVVLAVASSAATYLVLHYVHVNAILHPGLLVMLPFVAVAWLAYMIPLLMFISYSDDFKGLNPLNPVHYVHIARKSFRALSSNNFKVSEKDL